MRSGRGDPNGSGLHPAKPTRGSPPGGVAGVTLTGPAYIPQLHGEV